MFYVNLNNLSFKITLTLGDADTTAPPPLSFVFNRKGTNETGNHNPLTLDIEPGESFITIYNIPTSIFKGSGQYNYEVFNIDTPAEPVLIETGIFEVIATNPIIKTEYGTDKERGEYKGHI